MIRPQDALGKDQIHNEQEHNAGVCKHLSSDSKTGVMRVRSPCDSQHVRGDTGHAKAEKQTAEGEFVRSLFVQLKDGHVENGTADEEGQNNSTDGIVDAGRRSAAETSCLGEIGRPLGRYLA